MKEQVLYKLALMSIGQGHTSNESQMTLLAAARSEGITNTEFLRERILLRAAAEPAPQLVGDCVPIELSSPEHGVEQTVNEQIAA